VDPRCALWFCHRQSARRYSARAQFRGYRVRRREPRQRTRADHALAGALTAEGIIAGVSASAGPQMEGRPNVIIVEIGRKP
jgi:hypothetical protein